MDKYYTDIESAEISKTKPFLEVGYYSKDMTETALAGKIDKYPGVERDTIIVKF